MTEQQPTRRPVSPAVYRRRRLVVAIALIIVLVLIVWLIAAVAGASSGSKGAGGSPRPTLTATVPKQTYSAVPTPMASATQDAGQTPAPQTTLTPQATPALTLCSPAYVTVEALTDKQSYSSGELPNLSMRITNTGSTACSWNVGTSQQQFTITSGQDTWWRSKDCQTDSSDAVVVLEPGKAVASAAPIVWDRTRSSTSTCSSARPTAVAGGASYHLLVQVGSAVSTSSAQFFLN